MKQIETYVLFDLETTGLWGKGEEEVRITELSLIAIKRRQLCDETTFENGEPRVQYKLRMSFNPMMELSKKAEQLSGLTRSLLEHETLFDKYVLSNINSFINCLEPPVCLIAHNGLKFHFPTLKYHLNKFNVQLPPELICTDSLYTFYDLLKDNEKTSDWTEELQLRAKPYRELKRDLFFLDDPSPGIGAYILGNIYKREFEDTALKTNRAENQSVMIMKLAMKCKGFVGWVHNNHCAFSEVPLAMELCEV